MAAVLQRQRWMSDSTLVYLLDYWCYLLLRILLLVLQAEGLLIAAGGADGSITLWNYTEGNAAASATIVHKIHCS
jgi:hypothetical protein